MRASDRSAGICSAPASSDAGEFLEVLLVDFPEAMQMIREGRITDAKSVAALLWVKAFL